MVGDEAEGRAGGDQLIALRVAADGGQQHRPEPEAFEPHGNVHRHPAGAAGDAAGDVVAEPHRQMRPADHVPEHGADAEDVMGGGHASL